MNNANNKNCLNIIEQTYKEKMQTTPLLRNSVVVLELNKSHPLQVNAYFWIFILYIYFYFSAFLRVLKW